ncbi:hypothetical protein [Paenibacillus sp. BK033]|uniref:hypothetical protein n=2 Tax=unclassified Paenibacillus TaxID=185978 RepID=UPI001404FA90|nr:hypothetical protein [Paenibacillus sp. BK033]NIK71099.1 hypothetical protein [Paenibacillus sp. BK720]
MNAAIRYFNSPAGQTSAPCLLAAAKRGQIVIAGLQAFELLHKQVLGVRLLKRLQNGRLLQRHHDALRDFAAAKSIAPILAYLNERIAENVTLGELSAKFFISKHHLLPRIQKVGRAPS